MSGPSRPAGGAKNRNRYGRGTRLFAISTSFAPSSSAIFVSTLMTQPDYIGERRSRRSPRSKTATMIYEEGSALPKSSRTNADDRLPRASLGRVEGGDGIVEGRDVADVRPQASVPHPLDDLTQLGTIGLDDEVDRQAVGGPRLGRPDDGHQCSSGSNQACGPLLDVAADDIEHQIDAADVFQRVVVEVDELLRAEVERLLTVGSASGTDDVGAGLARELRHHRTDCAGRAVREDALPRPKAAVLEQSLPRGEARDWQARAHREVDVARQRREVACLDGHILRQGAVAMPVREAEHPLSYRQSRRAVAESGDHSGQLVAGDRRCSVTVAAIGPGRGPRHLSRDESRRMNLNDDVVYRCRRLGPLGQLHPGRSRSLIRYHDRLHVNCLLGHLSLWWKCRRDGKPVRHLMPGAIGRSRPIWTAPAGRVHRWARVAHGRTRMIVFPLRRSVRLKAATASSRVETLPMFVRSRPSRTRRTISLSWARSDSTTKSTAKPSAGRASVGPTTVTSVPPARIRPADRFWMSPPMTSNTRSMPPTSSSASLSRSTNSCAPKSSAF